MIHILSQGKTIANRFIAEMRDVDKQQDRMRFRRNLERLGEIFAYEISKTLVYNEREVSTPLGTARVQVADERVVLASVLRAGLPLHNGLLSFMDRADNAFISAYRKHHKDGTFEIEIEYISCPDLTDRVLIVTDAMLATGSSLVLATQALLENGSPRAIHFVTAIAAQQGVDYVRRHFSDAHLWIGALDEELTARSYIVPGLGDAGDLCFGEKLQD